MVASMWCRRGGNIDYPLGILLFLQKEVYGSVKNLLFYLCFCVLERKIDCSRPVLAMVELGKAYKETIVMRARKLRHYFVTHTIRVPTNHLLHDTFGNRDNSERINKWVTELSEYIVDFEKRSAIKSQILANFVA
jgi:hypothetical protein